MPRPSAILFDVGNTLVWLDHPFLVELLAEHGVETTAEAIMAAEYGAKLLLDEMARRTEGDPRTRGRAFFGEIFRVVGAPAASHAPLGQRLFERHAERGLWRSVRERTRETLDELRAGGLRLGVVSNADGRVEALLASLGLRDPFEVVIDSGSVGVAKPDPRIFRIALERMGVVPEDALYVGDIFEVDVLGARAAGMEALLVDPLDRWSDLGCERIRELTELPGRLGVR
jgi:putative hydrolase of the HAD superfamily